MNSGENINNAFKVVFKTLQNVESLINCCISNYDVKRYHMAKYQNPGDRFEVQFG